MHEGREDEKMHSIGSSRAVKMEDIDCWWS